MIGKSYYAILGVHQNASEFEIKSAYRSLVKRYHPDKNSSISAKKLFLEVQQAYEVLSNPDRKNTYDWHLQKIQNLENQTKASQTSNRPTEGTNDYQSKRNEYKKQKAEEELKNQQHLWRMKQKVFRFQKMATVPFILICMLLVVDTVLTKEKVTESIQSIQVDESAFVAIQTTTRIFYADISHLKKIKGNHSITYFETPIFNLASTLNFNEKKIKVNLGNIFLDYSFPFLPALFLFFGMVPFGSKNYSGNLLSCQYTAFFLAVFNLIFLIKYI